MKKLIFTLIIIFPVFCLGQIIHVPDDYATIQEAINAAGNGDTVLVDPGTYYEHLEIMSKTITLASLYLTTGDTNYISSTIIDGELSGRVLRISEVFESGRICGFTIQNGLVDSDNGGGIYLHDAYPLLSDLVVKGSSAIRGGGIFSDFSALHMYNVIVTQNTSTERGGGVMAHNADVHMINCELHDNSSPQGAGMYYYTNVMEPFLYSAIMESCRFYENEATGQTAGLYVRREGFNNEVYLDLTECDFEGNEAGAVTGLQIRGDSITFKLENCSFIGNMATDFTGAASFMGGCYGEIYNCLVCSNTAALGGGDWNTGGFTCWGNNVEVTIKNCTFADNDASYGVGLTAGAGATAYLVNNIFWGNGNNPIAILDFNNSGSAAFIDYCDVQYGSDSVRVDPNSMLNWGDHNITGDPLFMGAGDDPFAIGSGSPSIDGGTPDTSGMDLPPWDIIGNIRIWDGDGNGDTVIDMGAYEYGAPVWVGIEDIPVQASIQKMMLEIYPNPCREWVNLRISDPSYTKIEAGIYSLSGRKVKSLADINMQSGSIIKSLYLGDLKPGIYCIRLYNQYENAARKIIVL